MDIKWNGPDEASIVLSGVLAFRIVKNNDGYPGKAEDWFCLSCCRECEEWLDLKCNLHEAIEVSRTSCCENVYTH